MVQNVLSSIHPVSKRSKIGFQDQLPLNASQKFCRMLQGEHSAILLTFIKLHVPFVIKIFVLSIFEWPFYTCFTVFHIEKGPDLYPYKFCDRCFDQFYEDWSKTISVSVVLEGIEGLTSCFISYVRSRIFDRDYLRTR